MRTGALEVLTDRYEGSATTAPTDLVIDNQGRIYFTDPRYKEDRSDLEWTSRRSIARPGRAGDADCFSQPTIQKPTASPSPRQRHLFLVDSSPAPGGNRKIWAFDIDADLALSGQRLVYDFAPGRGGTGCGRTSRGICGLRRVSRGRATPTRRPRCRGDLRGHAAGRDAGADSGARDALTTGLRGPDLKTLYIVSGKSLFSIRVERGGHVVYPRSAG